MCFRVVCCVCVPHCVITVDRLRKAWPAIKKVVNAMAKYTVELHVGGAVCDLTWNEPGAKHSASEVTEFLANKVKELPQAAKEGLRLFLSVLKGDAWHIARAVGLSPTISRVVIGCCSASPCCRISGK